MTEPTNEMSDYCTWPAVIKAVEIDKHWLQWLTKEKGYTGIHLGDYLMRGNDGEQIMPKERFERLFYKLL